MNFRPTTPTMLSEGGVAHAVICARDVDLASEQIDGDACVSVARRVVDATRSLSWRSASWRRSHKVRGHPLPGVLFVLVGAVLNLRHWDARVTWAWLAASLSNRYWTA